jgi:ribonucleoside-diphosphate reductase alpha chain
MTKVHLSENALKVFEKRYLRKNTKGEVIETPEELFKRVAINIASAETDEKDRKYYEEEFYRIMAELKFLPNSPTLMNAGTDMQQLSACFVIPIPDSMDGIFKSVNDSALVYKSGGGCGFDFSAIRPAGSIVQSTQGVASGVISFMRVFDVTVDTIKQGGKRRGAALAALRVDHPEIMQFMECKKDGLFPNFNISVAITDKFMEALENGESYDLVDPHTKQPVGKLEAKIVWDKLVENAWKKGDPGIIFIDEINRHNPIPDSPIKSTNPCGEQPLNDYESCNLGSINLSKYFSKRSDTLLTEKELAKDIDTAIRFLDNVITMNKLPLQQIKEASDRTRKVGLGIMGWADLLTMAGIAYGSGQSLRIARKVMKFVKDCALESTHYLAKKRGPFPEFGKSIYKDEEPRRNATLITIAPTGTLSIIADCSSGIEPNFSLAFTKTVCEGEKLFYVNKYLEEKLKEKEIHNKKLIQKIADNGGILTGIDEIPSDIRKVFVTAQEVPLEGHIRMQSSFQKHVCNAVSKTINLPKDAPKEDVDRAYRMAFEEGLKGITVYRDGSKEEQPLTTSKSYGKKKEVEIVIPEELKRPDVTVGKNYKMVTGCGGLFINICESEAGVPVELFATIGKGGNCPKANMEALGRMVSLSFRNRIPPDKIIRQLLSIGCHRAAGMGPKKVLSCSDAIAKALKRYMEEKGTPVKNIVEKTNHTMCQDCGAPVEYSEGCVKCPQCGWSQCT